MNKELITTIKRELLQVIILGLRHFTMTPIKAQELARAFLSKTATDATEDILQALLEMGREYSEVWDVYLKYAAPYYDTKKVCMLKTIRECVEEGDIENAVQRAYGRCRT